MTANARRHRPNIIPVAGDLATPILAVFAQIAALDRIGAFVRPVPRCRDCRWQNGRDTDYGRNRFPHCDLGHLPLDLDDGCADWAAKGPL